MNLSTHFSFEELTLSDTAVRAGIDNTPPGQLMPNLVRLAAGLELVRAAPRQQPHSRHQRVPLGPAESDAGGIETLHAHARIGRRYPLPPIRHALGGL